MLDRKGLSRSVAVIALSAAIGATSVQGAHAAVPTASRTATSASAPSVATAQTQLEEALTRINAVPDSVIVQGDAAVSGYLQAKSSTANSTQRASGGVQPMFGIGDAWHIAKCAAAITVAIGGVAVPVAKVLKIKKLIKEVGGVKSLASKIIDVAKGSGSLGKRIKSVFKEFGTGVVGLAAEVLGIDAIASNCF